MALLPQVCKVEANSRSRELLRVMERQLMDSQSQIRSLEETCIDLSSKLAEERLAGPARFPNPLPTHPQSSSWGNESMLRLKDANAPFASAGERHGTGGVQPTNTADKSTWMQPPIPVDACTSVADLPAATKVDKATFTPPVASLLHKATSTVQAVEAAEKASSGAQLPGTDDKSTETEHIPAAQAQGRDNSELEALRCRLEETTRELAAARAQLQAMGPLASTPKGLEVSCSRFQDHVPRD